MKRLFQIAALGALLTICLGGCSKKNDNKPSSSAASSWSFAGTTYSAGTTVFTNNALLSIAKANSQETLTIQFSSRPSSGTYTVVAANPNNKQCVIQGTSLGGNSALLSQGGGSVNISDDNGKIQASFSNVPMVTVASASAGNLTGNLTEQ